MEKHEISGINCLANIIPLKLKLDEKYDETPKLMLIILLHASTKTLNRQ